MRIAKRVACLLMVLVMALGTLLPVMARAEGGDKYIIHYMDGGDCVKTQEGVVALPNHTFTVAEAQTYAPAGRAVESVSTNGLTVTAILKSATPEQVRYTINYIDGTTVVKSFNGIVDAIGHKFTMAEVQAYAPEGREVESFTTNEQTVTAILKALPQEDVLYTINYLDGETVVSSVNNIPAPRGHEFTIAEAQAHAPSGRTVQSVTTDGDLVIAILAPNTYEITLHFLLHPTNEEVAAKDVAIKVGQLSLAVTAPEGYQLFDTNNVITLQADRRDYNVYVIAKPDDKPVTPTSRTIAVKYVLAYGGEPIGTEDLTVDFGTTALKTSQLKKIPQGYELVDSADKQINDTTKTVEFLVRKMAPVPVDKVITIIYQTANGTHVAQSTMTVSIQAKTINVKDLKDVPYGYILVSQGDVEIDERDTVRIIVKQKPTDPNKDKVPKTGDETPLMLFATLSMLSAAAAASMIVLKKKSENR